MTVLMILYKIHMPGRVVCCCSSKEKKDVDELETEESSTRMLFLEQGNLEEAKAKEWQEYLDAKNKEVKIYI